MMETMQRQLDVLGVRRAQHESVKVMHRRRNVELEMEVNSLMESYVEVCSDVSFMAGDMQDINDRLEAQMRGLAERKVAALRKRSEQE
jgi:hypothetical protein